MSGPATWAPPAERPLPTPDPLGAALGEIAAGASELDRDPRFPSRALALLGEAGVTSSTVGAIRRCDPVAGAWLALRRIAAADASVARILDGHLNAVERIELAAPPSVRDAELEAVASGRLLGLWGADPGPGEGSAAEVVESRDGLVLRGAKTYCSGAGGVGAALVMARDPLGGPPPLVLVECDDHLTVDRSWYRAAGLRASESHRVHFDDAPVRCVLGEPGELGREPFFSRDAMRTAATWAGMVDAAADASLSEIAERRAGDPLAALAAGRISAARETVSAWLAHAAAAVDAGHELWALSIQMRAEIDRAAKLILALAAASAGSSPFVTGRRLDRARRDLETFLLQHRLEPLLGRCGAEISAGAG